MDTICSLSFAESRTASSCLVTSSTMRLWALAAAAMVSSCLAAAPTICSCSAAMPSRADATLLSLAVRCSTVILSWARSRSRTSTRLAWAAEWTVACWADSASLEARSLTWVARDCSVLIFFLSCDSSTAALALAVARSISAFLALVRRPSASSEVSCRVRERVADVLSSLALTALSSSSSEATRAWRAEFSSPMLSRTPPSSADTLAFADSVSLRLASRAAILVARNRSVSPRLLSCASRELT
mmetsp:Transcript_62334/g.184447  ORF Transcript_62334/g.184447 Transcript_62334/m.184447 type:complete len:244 (+) Transcript_62334:1195-1926(+)